MSAGFFRRPTVGRSAAGLASSRLRCRWVFFWLVGGRAGVGLILGVEVGLATGGETNILAGIEIDTGEKIADTYAGFAHLCPLGIDRFAAGRPGGRFFLEFCQFVNVVSPTIPLLKNGQLHSVQHPFHTQRRIKTMGAKNFCSSFGVGVRLDQHGNF